MVNLCRSFLVRIAAPACLLLLCQCETTRTVKSTRSSFTFDEKMWGGQGQADSSEIRSKFAERGYKIAEDGTIVADKPNLYSGQTPRGLEREFDTKEARFKKMDAETKEFRTPEYLQRQEFRGVTEARESGRGAREGNSTRSPDLASGKLFEKRSKDSTQLAAFETGSDRASGEVFPTSPAPDADAVRNAPRATGTPRKMGYQDNVAMSMDDVKKMLNPGAYARGTGISE